MRDRLLSTLARSHSNHPWRMLLFVLILTVLFAVAAMQLQVTMRWSDLLPQDDPRTIQFNKIVDEFKTSTSLTIVVQGDEQRIKRFADELAPQITEVMNEKKNADIDKKVAKLQRKIARRKNNNKDVGNLEKEMQRLLSAKNQKLFQRVDYKMNMAFLRDHGMLLIKKDDLDNARDMFLDPNLIEMLTNFNNAFEKEYSGREESL